MHESSAGDYDVLPYEGHPDPMIHPDRMACVGWLHGVEAAGVERARVLEIGCAAGAHLIPMAYQLPEATFVGFDYSPRQIAMAEAGAKAAGLGNIRFEVRDIRAGHEGLGEFDYILAHGVFSWVPRAVQDALLALCRAHLAPNGVAFVDYNVYPGWHLRRFLGDLVRYHQVEHPEPAKATEAALRSLDYVAGNLFVPASPFGQMAGQLQKWAKQQGRNYLVHEFGSAAGEPVTFCEFAERAKGCGLEIMGDAEITQVVPAQVAGSLATKLGEVAGSDYVRHEQYLDFLRGRDFRRTLLVRDSVEVSRQMLVEPMRRVRFTTVARQEPAAQGAVFRGPDGSMLRTMNDPVIRALGALCKAGPEGMMFEGMYQWGHPGAGGGAEGGGDTVATFAAGLLEVAAGGLIQVHAHCPRVVGQVSKKPVANAVARASASAGQPVATSMLQRDWSVDGFERALLCLLDGTRGRGELAAALVEGVKRGEFSAGGPGIDVKREVEGHLGASLEWFARVGILVG